MSVTMKTQPKLAILALSLFLAAGSAQAITLGIGSGKQVVAPTVVHSDSATEDSEADKDAGNYGPDTVAEKNTDATRLGAYLEAMRALDPSVWWMDGPRQTHVSDRTGADISVVTKPVYRGFFDVCEMLSYTQLEKKQSLAQKVGRTGRLESNAIAVPFGKDAG